MKLYNFARLSAIQIGGVICMPVLMIGQSINQHFGFSSALIAIVLGNVVLFFLGLIAAKMSVESRKTTMENAIDYFGRSGVKLFSLAMAASLMAWFGLQLNMMTLGALDLFSIDSKYISTALNIFLGSIITLSALSGIKGVSFLANLSLPLLVFTLLYAVLTIEHSPKVTISHNNFSLALPAISLIISQAIAAIIDLPTYFCHAKSTKHAYISILIVFGLSLPLLEIMGAYLADASNGGSFLDIFKRSDSAAWNIFIALFLILAGWTTNNINLYSGVMGLNAAFPSSFHTFTFGMIGTLLSCVDLLSHLHLVLEIIGLFIGSMGGVILSSFLFSLFRGIKPSRNDHKLHLAAWLIGIFAGFLSLLGFSMTRIAVLDASAFALLSLLFFQSFIKRSCYETN